MSTQHLSRLNSPMRWPIQRKGIKFITRPSPGAHTLGRGIALCLVMTNLLKVARTRKEVKKILHEGKVLVNNRVRRDPAFTVGLMDVVSIPNLKQAFRVVYTEKGKFTLQALQEKDQGFLLGKIVGKTVLKKGKVQIRKASGTTLLVEKDSYKTGDTLVQTLSDSKVVDHLPFAKGAMIYLTGGSNIGKSGVLDGVKGHTITVKTKAGTIETAKRYAFVIGKYSLDLTQ